MAYRATSLTDLRSRLADSDVDLPLLSELELEPHRLLGRLQLGRRDLQQHSPTTGVNFNRYRYASNNPYRVVDPDGRRDQDARLRHLDMEPTSPQEGRLDYWGW